MIKWFAYIVLLLGMAPCLSSAKSNGNYYAVFYNRPNNTVVTALTDTTTKNTKPDDKKKVKEIGKARRQPKPEKIGTGDEAAKPKTKPKRQRRPEGLERPPEIPRRNGGG